MEENCTACNMQPHTHVFDGDKLCDICIKAILEGSADVIDAVLNVEQNYRVKLSGKAFVKASATVAAASPELAGEMVLKELGDAVWEYDEFEEGTASVDEVLPD